MTRTVLLPQELDERLDKFTGIVEEVTGVLLYRRAGDSCPIDYLFVTAIGRDRCTIDRHVEVTSERSNVVYEFLRKAKDYCFVQFRTRTKSTIAECGEKYATSFSDEDMAIIGECLRWNKSYMALLVTPQTKLLYGSDSPTLTVVQDLPGYEQRSKAVGDFITAIATQVRLRTESEL